MGGKKGRKWNKKKKRNDDRKQPHEPYQHDFTERTVEMGNFKMEAYYALQGIHNHYFNEEGKLVACQTAEEMNHERLRWRTAIGKILPASFRTAFDISESLKERLERELEELVEEQEKAAAEAKKEAGDDTKAQIEVDNLKKSIHKIPFLPHAYQFLEINRKTIRKDPTMKSVFEWMKKQTEAGFITRQETVSMVPPVVLDPHPDDSVLDMCAAPGSKTCQILEKLSPKGSMVANDASNQRAYMLVSQLRRIMHNNPVVLVTSAEAQFFPQSLSFDKILADVPCSGDGTSRKNIGIWKQWSQGGALALHALQLDIAWKGVAMLKVGGYICYSTCSYNPVENEAVVAELLRRAKGSLELVDAPLEGFKVRPGLSHWNVLAEEKSKRQMMNEKKKNNAKMRQRRAEWAQKEKEAATDDTNEAASENAEENKGAPETEVTATKKTDEEEKYDKEIVGEHGKDTDVKEETNEEDVKEKGEKDKTAFLQQKFEPPSSWDDETLIGLTRAAGLTHFNTIDDVPSNLKKRVKKSCFPPTEEEAKGLHLKKCIRCLAHDNDTGGFFVALLKKTAPVSLNEAKRRATEETEAVEGAERGPDVKKMKASESAQEVVSEVDKEDDAMKEATESSVGVGDEKPDEEMEAPTETSTKPSKDVKGNRMEDGKGGKHKDVGRDDFVTVDENLFGPLIEYFGFSDSFPKDQIMTRAIGGSKVLYFLAKSVKENFIEQGIQQRVTIIGSGVKAFVRNTNWGSDCVYRLSQEGIHFLLPHMSKRKTVACVEDFTKCLVGEGKKIVQLSEFSEEFSKVATEMSVGPFVVLLKGYETDYSRKLFIVMWRCRGTTVNCMVNKAEVEGMKSKVGALQEEENLKEEG